MVFDDPVDVKSTVSPSASSKTSVKPSAQRARNVYTRAFQSKRAALNGIDTSQYMGGWLSDIFSPAVSELKKKVASITGSDVAKAAVDAYAQKQAADKAKANVEAAKLVAQTEAAKQSSMPFIAGSKFPIIPVALLAGAALIFMGSQRRK